MERMNIEYGLFAHNYGDIYNLELLNSKIDVKTSSAFVGNIVGYNLNNVTNCISSGDIIVEAQSTTRIGGISGSNRSTSLITDCKNYTNLNVKKSNEISTVSVGGIAGTGANITRCANYGNIITESYSIEDISVGGICGTSSTKLVIQECFNKGIINVPESKGKLKVGGILGYGSAATINNCYNTEKITISGEQSEIRVGGIAGYNYGGLSYKISNCYNVGKLDVESMANLGEIIGNNYETTVEYCYYLDSSGNKGVGFNNAGIDNSISVSDIMSDELLENLNSNQSSTIWKKGNSYLELYWE